MSSVLRGQQVNKTNENGIPVFKKSFKFYKLYFKGSFTLNCYITTPQCKSIQVLPLKTYLLLQTDLIPLSAAVAFFCRTTTC